MGIEDIFREAFRASNIVNTRNAIKHLVNAEKELEIAMHFLERRPDGVEEDIKEEINRLREDIRALMNRV